VHLNSVQLIGRLSKRPELRYTESGTPFCSLVVACDELGPGDKIFTTWIPVDITGKYAQQSAVDLEEGDEVQISGKLKYKSVVDKQTQQKTSKLMVSTWGVQQRTPAQGTAQAEIVAPEGGEAALPKQGKPRPRYPKHLQQVWQPEHAN
jgi:single-strand DNA-binding protein